DGGRERGHGHDGRGQGGEGAQGRQDRVPGGQERDRARPGREEVLRGRGADGEPADVPRGDRAGQARGGQGPVHPVDHAVVDDGAGRAHRSGGIPSMIRTKAQKQEQVTALATRLARSPTVYVPDFTGLNVSRIPDLPRRLRTAGVGYVVVTDALERRGW